MGLGFLRVNGVILGHRHPLVLTDRGRGGGSPRGRSPRELTPHRGGASSARCASGGGGDADTRGCRRAGGRGSGGSRRAAACCTRCGAPHTSSGSSRPGTRRTSGRARRRRQHGARRHCAASGACRRCSASCAGRAAWPRRRVLRGKASSFLLLCPPSRCRARGICIVASARLRAGGAPGLWRIATGSGRARGILPHPGAGPPPGFRGPPPGRYKRPCGSRGRGSDDQDR